MRAFERAGRRLHFRDDGPADAPVVLLVNALGTDSRLWDAVTPLLPTGLRCLRFDKVGHGLSDSVAGPPAAGQAMLELTRDADALLDHLGVEKAVVVGLSIGGLITQALATGFGGARQDRVSAIALICTAARVGAAEMWEQRIQTTLSDGVESMADAIMLRWFSERFRAEDQSVSLWRNMLTRTAPGGYATCCAALRDADFTEACAQITAPALCVAAGADEATPPDDLKALARLIPNARYAEIAGAGHLPSVEAPEDLARLLSPFLSEHAGR